MTDMSNTNGSSGAYASSQGGGLRYADYEQELGLCGKYIKKDFDMAEVLQKVADRETDVVIIDLLSVGQTIDSDFVERIQENVLRYVELFSTAIMEALPQSDKEIENPDSLDYYIQHNIRLAQQAQMLQGQEEGAQVDFDPNATVPKELRQRFEVKIVSSKHPVSIREIRAKDVGHLINVKGIVTRVTKVKPNVRVATYTCSRCEHEVYQIINTPEFMPLKQCTSPVCRSSATPGQLTLGERGSKFLPYQEVRIQEMSDQVPAGHIPRSLVVKANGACTRRCGPGDMVSISGVFLPTPYHGFAKLRAGLLSDTYLEAMQITKEKKE